MANSKVSICNNALLLIGCNPITSLTDGNKAANACNLVFDRTLDTLLRMHLWNFAVTRATLASETATPAFGYAYSYPLPADYIRIVGLEDTNTQYKIERGKLLTDANVVNVVYISRIEDVTKYDPLFVEAFILMLAMNLSYILIGSHQRIGSLKEEFERKLFLAKQVDGQEDTPDQLQAETFLNARYGYDTSWGNPW
jgi:hypothetical protein